MNIDNIRAKTDNQHTYLRSIIESNFTICDGPAGSGKSYLAIGIACQYLNNQKTSKILITRPIIGCDNEIGALPGNLNDKIEAYMKPYMDYCLQFLGKEKFEFFRKRDKIQFYPVELLRGHTYNNSIMILEEGQNSTTRQMKLFISRVGNNSKIIIAGDTNQCDISKQNSGLDFCINNLSDIKQVSIVNLGYQDIIRNKHMVQILRRFDEKGV